MTSKRVPLLLLTIAVASASVRAQQTVTTEPAASTQADASPPAIVWPAGWVERKSGLPEIKQFAVNVATDAGATFAYYPKSDYADGLSLRDWVTHRVELLKETPGGQTATIGEPTAAHVGGGDAIVLNVDMTLKASKFHYVHVYVERGDYFCSFTIWSLPSHAKAVEPLVDDLVARIRQPPP